MIIKSITHNYDICHTYDLEVPFVQNYCIEDKKLVSHNSSVCQNATNGMEPIRKLISHKKSKGGILKQVVPNIEKYGKYYDKAFDAKSNVVYTNVGAILQKWFDMSLSLNHYYNYAHYENGNIPLSVIIKDMLYAYKMGIKTLYYANTPDGDEEMGCAGGACAL